MAAIHRFSISALVLALPGIASAGNWPAWRGPTGQGVSAETDLPLRWSQTDNVRWKAALPGPGNSTPAVWGERVFVTQSEKNGAERTLVCFQRRDGSVLWRKSVAYSESEPTHEDNPFCSASPATDGRRVVVAHGSAGVYAYDFAGTELWRHDTGKLHHVWGNASSPVIHGRLCFLNCGPGERTFLLALDVESGRKAWQIDISGGREGGDSSTWTGSWSTPLLVREEVAGAGERESLLVSFPHALRAFEPASGKEVWSCEGLGRLVYASPLHASGIAVAMSGFMGPPLAARTGGLGDVTSTHRLWRSDRAPQRIGSGVIRDGHIFTVNDAGVAECHELATGTKVYQERLGARSWASVVLSGERLYIADDDGGCFVWRAAPRFELLARSELGERVRASIAVSDRELFIRGHKHLWCIAAPVADTAK